MAMPVLFIKSIKPPQASTAPDAQALAAAAEKLQELAQTIQELAGGDAGAEGSEGGNPEDDDPGANDGTAQDMNAGGDGDGAGDDPDAAANTATPGATGSGGADDSQTPGAEGGDATDPTAGGNGADDPKFGAHNVEKGHHIAFQAGDFKGAGKVTATGGDGCTAQDSTGREHRVNWNEVTGHNDAAASAGAAAKAPAEKKPDGIPKK